MLASGLIGIALAVYLWANLSTISDWVLGLLLGILLVVEGAALTSMAWHVRREFKRCRQADLGPSASGGRGIPHCPIVMSALVDGHQTVPNLEAAGSNSAGVTIHSFPT